MGAEDVPDEVVAIAGWGGTQKRLGESRREVCGVSDARHLWTVSISVESLVSGPRVTAVSGLLMSNR
jgi:hypothetical protein